MVTIAAPFLKYSFTVGMTTMDGRGFYYPTDTVMGKNGRLYVPNRGIPRVERGVRICVCDVDGGYYGNLRPTRRGRRQVHVALERRRG